MKQLNFLSKSGGQSMGLRVTTLALTVGSPSAHRRSTMLKHVAFLLLFLFAFGIGNAWGANVTWQQVAWSDISTSDVIIVTVTSNNVTYLLTSANGDTATPKLGNTGTLGSNNTTCTFSENDNVKWKKDASNRLCMATNSNKWLYTGTSNNAMRVGTSTSGNQWTQDGDYIKSNTSSARYLSVYSTTDFRSYTSKSDGQVTRFYKAGVSCDKKVTVTKSTATNGSFTLKAGSASGTTINNSGTVDNCDADATIVVIPSANTHYHVSEVTATDKTNLTGPDASGNYTITYTKGSNISTTIGVTFAADPTYTVTWVAGSNSSFHTQTNYAGTALTDPGTPSAASYCPGGKVFVGWTATEIDGTTNTQPADLFTSVSGMSIPATDKTYYAVFATSGSSSKTYSFDITASNFNRTSYAANNNEKTSTATATDASGATMDVKWTSNQIMLQSSAMQWQKNNGYIYNSTDLGTINSVTVTSSAGTFTTYYGTTSQPSSGTQGTGKGYFKTSVGNATGTTSKVAVNFTKTTTSYSNYATTCCQPLGSINGSISVTQTTATLTWDNLSNVAASNPYAVTYRTGDAAFGNANVGSITTNDQGKKTCTITGLECGTEYDFKIAVTGDGSHCDAEQVLEDKSTTKWNIEYNLSGTIDLSNGPAQGANACGDISATFSKNALYSFPATITVTIGGETATVDDYLWDASEGALLIGANKVTGNIVVAIAGVAPLNPIVTPSPDILSFEQVKKGAAVPAAKDIAITGQNLTDDLTVTSSDPTLYAVSVKSGSLTPDGDKNASPVITVMPQEGITSTAGDKNAIITISGGGLTADVVVNVTFNVQETYTVNWYVNGTKIDANSKTDVEGTAVTAPSDFSTFTDCSELHFVGWATSAIAVAGTTTEPELVTPITAIGTTATTNYYAVFAEGTPASEVELMNEDFANELSNDNSNAYGTTNGGSKPAGFTGALDKAYAGKNGTAKLGSSSAAGYITSKSLDLSEAFSVSIKVKRYNDTDGGNVEITIDGDNDTKQVISNDDINSSTFESFKLNFDAATSTSTIKIATSTKRAYIDDVVVSQASDPVWTKWYTTCPHCNAVALSKAGEADGNTFALQVSGSDVTSVKTCEAATVDVVASPATGNELTGVALNGVAGASYAEGVITIPQDAEGTLVATATFAQKNYSIAVETYPENIGATLGGATSTAKYGVEQTISTDEPTGYIFGGWYIYDAEDTEKETDLSEEIFTGTYEGQELELSASFLMPDKNLVAEAYFDKIYTVNEFAELSKTNNETYYIEGLICQINGFYSSKYITYLISVDGVNSGNTVLVYNGSGLNGVDFTAASDLSIGDKVIVAGKWNTSNSRINNSKQISYTAAALSALEIVGTASVTTYDVGDSFDNTGLSVTATYNTGYVVTNYDATITSDYDAPTTFTAGVTSVTVSASEGLINTERVIPVTVSSAVLDHAELAAGVQTEFWAKESYKEPLLNAYLNDEPATVLANVTGVTDVSGLDMSVAGDKHVTITYTRKAVQTTTVGYDFTVKPVVVDEAHAHSVSTAREIIDVDKTDGEDLDLDLEGTKTHVVGVVTSVNALTGSNAGKYTIVIKDQTDANKVMTLYQVTLKSGITSVAEDDLIKAYGNLYYHTNSSKYEIDTGGEVVAVVRTPNLTVADVAEMEVNFTADLGEDDLTIDKDGSEGAITFSCSDAAVTIVDNKLHAAAAGDATVTATIAASGIYTEASTTFNVHVIAERTRYAITMDANGGTGTDPVIANQLEGAPVTLPECSYSWAKHGFTGWTVINLSTSAEIEIENNQFTMPAANVKIQAQWEEIATTHIVFNVNGNTETVAAVDVPQAVEYSITQETDGQNGYEFVGWAENPETEDVEEAIATIESYTPEADEASKTLYAVFKRVDEGAPKTDVLTAADLAATSTGYVEFSGVSKTSNAVYAGNSAKNEADAIQLRSKESNSGIVSTTTGGVLQSVKINVASGSNTIDVYGSNTAYSAASDLYATGNNANQGTKIGSTSSTATINAVADYKYVGIRSNSGAIYLSRVEFVWQPKTTYYTTAPSAVYAVSYALGEGGAWQEDEGCDGANVKTGQTFDICESVPVRDGYKFNGWTVGGEAVSGTITIHEATAITANWLAKAKSNITYNAGTGTGDDAVDGNNEEGAEIILPSAADKSLSKEGYDFVGWLYGGDLYKAGTTFEMPASAVTFVAQWKKQNITKMTLVTDASQLVNGSKVVLANQTASTVAGESAKESDTYLAKVNGTFNEDKSILTNLGDGIELTLVQVTGGWALEYNGKYLKPYSTKKVAWDATQTVWTISISSNNAIIETLGNSGSALRYNKNTGSERFSAYSSKESCEPIQLYANVTAVTENASISDLGYVEGDVIVVSSGATLTMDAPSAPASITVKENAVVNVSAATEAGTVIVEKGAKLAIEEGGSVTTDEPLVLYTTLGKGTGTNTSGNAPGSSSEIINAERLNATGDVYLEIELTQDAKASAGWYAFSVPFPVDAMNGVYYGDTKLTNEVGYAIMSYHGDVRAQGLYGWKKYREIMQPGVLYIITVGDTDYKKLRFKKVAGADLAASNSVAVKKYASETGNNKDGGWNGIGNPNLQISYYGSGYIHFLDHDDNAFKSRTGSNINLVVGSAFFIQYSGNEDGSVVINKGTQNNANGYLAPARERQAIENVIHEVKLYKDDEEEDNVFLTVSEDASNDYEIGRDVAKMSMGTAKCAQMWVPAYGTQLCAADFPLVNDKATYPLTINAPSAGTYTISAAETSENATLYLTKNGRIYWNLTMGACELDLKQGQNNEYGLVLRADAPQVTTGVDEINAEAGVQKVVIDEHVYILRGGEMYDMTGKMVK